MYVSLKIQVLPALIIWSVLVVSIALPLRKPLREIRRLRRVSRVSIGLLPSAGIVEVAGLASGADLRSPLTDTTCVFWQVEVEAYRGSGRHGSWTTLLNRTSTTTLTIDDGTGQVQVQPAKAEFHLRDDLRTTRGLFKEFEPEIAAKLTQLDLPTHGHPDTWRGSMRAYERYITSGEHIFVIGAVEHSTTRPIIGPSPDGPVILADRSERTLLKRIYLNVGYTAAGLAVLVFIGCWVFLAAILGQP